MADKITNDITLLFKTKLDDKSKQEVGKNLKSLLENAAIGFDEAETKRNLEPIIRMMKRLFDKAEIAFDADQLLAMPSRQALQKMAEMEVDQLQMAFDKALVKSGGIKVDFGDMDLSAMTEPLERLTQELSEIGERVASTTKKSVREIENTLTSLTKTKKLDETVSHIEKTLEAVNNPKHYTSQNSATKALENARNAYTKSVESNDPWEKQYQHLLTFVSRYEAMTEKVKPLVDENRPEFKQLYEMLSPKAGAVKISLQHLVDLRQGNELTEYKNQPWARENTLKKIEQTLRNGITVKEGSSESDAGTSDNSTPPWEDVNDKPKKPNTKVPLTDVPNVEAEQQARIEAEKRRIEEEKIIEAQVRAAKKLLKKNEIDGYRGVHKPISGEGKYDTKERLGAPYWTDELGKDVFLEGYGVGSELEGAANLKARFKPLNPVTVSGQKDDDFLTFDRIDEIKELQYLFPGVREFTTGDSELENDKVQKFYNEMARQAGFDLLRIDDINEGSDTTATSMAPLQDRIVNYVGELPDYYEVENLTPEMEREIISRQKGAAERWYNETIARLESQLNEAIAKDDFATQKDLKDLLPRLKEMKQSAMTSFDSAISIYGGYIEEAVYEGLPQTISSNGDGKLVEKFSFEELRAKLEEYVNLSKEMDDFREKLPQKEQYSDAKEYKAAKREYDDQEETYQQKMDQLYGQLVNRLPNEIQGDIDNLLLDLVDNAVNIDDVFEKLKPHLTYDGAIDSARSVQQKDSSNQDVKEIQVETAARKDNASAIVAETHAQKELNEVKAQSLLPQKEDFVAGDMDPSDEQKEKVLALGEEYRAILSILEKGDSELTAALKERANAIMEVMQKINIQDGFMDNTYRNTYGGDFKTASELMNWQKVDSLFLENYDSSTIDDTSRQAVIDLIHQEIEARKQSIEVKREENAVDQQQNINALKSKYESATEQEKALVQDIINIRKDEKHLEQFDDDASEEALDKLISERLNKARALREANKELWDAITSIGRDELGKYIDVSTNIPAVASEVAATSGVSAEIKDSIQTEELRQLLNSITYNVKVVQDAEPTEDNKISIDEAALENVLNRITYNVKIAHDDADKTANKIVIDEGVLEQTLNRVFANVLNPEVEQSPTEPKNEPWALEKTLLSVKEVLNDIRTNIAKTESVEIAPARTEVGNVLATENTLAAIKSIIETINSKVVKGTKTTTSAQNTAAKKLVTNTLRPVAYSPERKETNKMSLEKLKMELKASGRLTDELQKKFTTLARSLGNTTTGAGLAKWNEKFKQFKLELGTDNAQNKGLHKQAEELGTWLAKAEKENTQEAQNHVVELQEKIKAQQVSLKLTKEERDTLAQITEETKQSTLNKLNDKQADKDTKKQAANAKKMAQREAMLGKAGNAVGRAENTWMSAVGIEGELPADFVSEVDEYYRKLDALRKKHQELKNSDMISEEQKKELITQTMSINKMTDEIGELVAEYQRLSGSNVDETKTQTTTLSDKSPLANYETELKQYAKSITDGKAQIKSFNAETKTLTYTVKTGKNEFTEYTAAVRHLDGQMVAVQGTTKRTETFFEATTRKMKELTSYFSGMAVFNRVGQELRRGIQYVREIDLALTELKKVTDETEESYDRFLKTAAKTGARLGSTISAVTEATATFAKLGYTISEATEMAEAAIVYKNVGDNIASTEDAADSIISTMKGFKLEATESMAIVDRFNEVGNRFAITSQGIGEALRLSASALSEGGNSLDESIGLITAANEVVSSCHVAIVIWLLVDNYISQRVWLTRDLGKINEIIMQY